MTRVTRARRARAATAPLSVAGQGARASNLAIQASLAAARRSNDVDRACRREAAAPELSGPAATSTTSLAVPPLRSRSRARAPVVWPV